MSATPEKANGQDHGQCPRCGTVSPHTAVICSACFSRLPWAEPPVTDKRSRKPLPPTPSLTAKGGNLPAPPISGARAPVGSSPPGGTPPGGSTPLPPPRSGSSLGSKVDIVVDDDSSAKTRLGIGLGIGLLVAVVVGFFVFKGMQPQPIEAPTQFTSFTAGDKSFVCDAPTDWENTTATAGHGVAGNARFKKGAARIEVTSDLAGSLMADIARAGSAGVATPQKSPVQKVHEMGTESMSNKFNNYEEMPGQSFQGSFGETWSSEFTADGGFRVGKIHGYRVTMMGGERRFTVVCQCPEADWDKLKPAFDRVRDSLAAGPG